MSDPPVPMSMTIAVAAFIITTLLGLVGLLFWRLWDKRDEEAKDANKKRDEDAKEANRALVRKTETLEAIGLENRERIHKLEKSEAVNAVEVEHLKAQVKDAARMETVTTRLSYQDEELRVMRGDLQWLTEKMGRKASRSEMAAAARPSGPIPRVDPDSDPPPPRPRLPSVRRGDGE